MAKTPPRKISPRRWYWATFAIFAGQGILSTAFWTRSPEIQHLLGVDVALMGLLGFVNSIGGLIGILLGAQIVPRIGIRASMIGSYTLVGTSLIAIALTTLAHSTVGTALFLFLIGLGSGLSGLSINLEGASVDRASTRSLLPSLHGAFSAGTLAGSAIGATLIALHVNLLASFALILFLYVITMAVGVPNIPRHSGRRVTEDMDTQALAAVPSRPERRAVLRETRTWGVMFIVFGFTLGEAVAGTWLPIALVQGASMGAAAASFGLSLYFAGMTLGRFTGGLVVDRIGRSHSLLLYPSVAILGILIVAATPLLHAPYVGAALWGLGLSVGFPLCVSALSIEPRLASTRVGYLATTGSVSVTAGPPLIGVVGQYTGLLTAFLIPAVVLGGGLFANRHTKLAPHEVKHHETALDEV